MAVILVCLFIRLAASQLLYEGDGCTDARTTTPGVCCFVHNCQSARDDLRSRIKPTLCSFCESTAVVCCRYGCGGQPGPPAPQPPTFRPIPPPPASQPPPPAPQPPTQTHSGVSSRKSQTMCASYDAVDAEQPAPPPRPVFVKVNATLSPFLLELLQNNSNKRTRRQDDDGFVHIAAVGGEDANVDEFPHMAAIGWPLKTGSFAFNCGGTLISDKWVLTAGHCLSNSRDTTVSNTEPTIVRLGDQNILDTVIDGAQPIDVPIEKRLKHPNYKPPSKYYDIALLGLRDSVKFSKHVKPACLWTDEDLGTHLNAIVTGWGTTVSGGKKGSDVLQKVKLDIIESATCDSMLTSSRNRNWQGFSDHQLCAGVLVGGKDACQGDSGGPLQVKSNVNGVTRYHVIGITSFGRDCAKPNLPGVYTRVSAFVEWIENIVWP